MIVTTGISPLRNIVPRTSHYPKAGVIEYATTSSSFVLKHYRIEVSFSQPFSPTNITNSISQLTRHKFPMPSSKPGANTLFT